MSDKKITVVSVCYKANRFIKFMVDTCLKTSNNISEIVLCDNNSDAGQSKALNSQFSSYSNVRIIKGKNPSKNTSENHGIGLNTAMKEVGTELVAIIESDVILLNRGWDTIDDKTDMIAYPKNNYAGYDVYSPCFILARYDKIKNVNFRPQKNLIGKYGDTGARLSLANLRVKKLEKNHCVLKKGLVLRGKYLKKTHEFLLDGVPVAAHFTRGSELGRRKSMSEAGEWFKDAERVLKSLK